MPATPDTALLQVLLIRHAITVAQTGGKVLNDDKLAPEGEAAASSLAVPLTAEKWADVKVVYVSPLSRTLETAVRAFAKRCECGLR